MSDTLKEAKRLYDLGAAVIWLHQKSKRPVESGWTTGPRKSWGALSATFTKGLNVGVRLGTPSKLPNGYLAVIDVDVKSDSARHRNEALEAAKGLLGGTQCPIVTSGRGNGSCHLYVVTAVPFKTFNPAVSRERVKVLMPSKQPSRKERETLSQAELAKGLRLANAWEVSLYSDGRQVVVPPSVHPDTGKTYAWSSPFFKVKDLPLVEFAAPHEIGEEALKATTPIREVLEDFNAVPVDLDWLTISETVKAGIVDGTGVEDRSGFLLRASTALFSAGLGRDEVLSVLTDPATYLGKCAYEHAQTKSRKRAALWVWRYTVKRVMRERDAVSAFREAPPVKIVKDDEVEEENNSWQDDLQRTEKGHFRNSLHNCITIVKHVCKGPVVGRNEFAHNDYYLINSPWTSKKGDAVCDHDLVRIKAWCVKHFGIEFGDNTINQTLLHVADKNRFHPVRDWLKSLKWDGVKRIDGWLKDYAGARAPEPYLSNISAKLLVAMVARIFKPGTKFDQIVILEGAQGVGKSSLFRHLVGDAWFSDAPLVMGDKDAVMTMQSKWVLEFGELTSLNKTEVETFKSFLSQQVDRIRLPYGKRTEEFPRQTVIVGTTNNDEYLKDETGNRRFWVVKTEGQIKFKAIAKLREQLFAEACVRYHQGEVLYLDDKKAREQATEEQAQRLQHDPWMDTIQSVVEAKDFPIEGFEMNKIFDALDIAPSRVSPWDAQRTGKCLRALGFEKFRARKNNTIKKFWRRSVTPVTPVCTLKKRFKGHAIKRLPGGF